MSNGPDSLGVGRQFCAVNALCGGINEEWQDYGENTSFPWHTLYIDAPGMTLYEFA